ncbi:MAG: ribonuclease III, partial [Candidatus Blackburnbacteria bacterium RIFCSPLOWO2_01_FULL_44_43]
VHRSFLNERKDEKESNERLEFLGDAVLEFLVSNHIYLHFPGQDEGHLTALRSKLVNTTSLAQTARNLNLGESLYLSRGEEQGGGRTNTSLLANTVEALLGAIFLDQGVDGAGEFVDKFILTKIPETVRESLKDPKSMLQEFVQAQGLPAPIYKLVSQIGPDHAKEFTVEVLIDKKPYAQGKGSSKKIATQDAAALALQQWKANNSQ